MKNISNVLYKFSNTAISFFACIFSGLIFLLNFMFNSVVGYDSDEKVTISYHIVKSIIMIAVAAVLIFAAAYFKKYISKINEKGLFCLLSIMYTLFALYLIFNCDSNIRADASTTFSAAKAVLGGDYSTMQVGGYIHRYPHQSGLMLYDQLLMQFSENTAFNFLVNFFFVLGINFFNYKIADQLFKSKSVNLLTVAVSFAFLPQFFYIMFAYGLIPGFFFMIVAFYNTIKYADNRKLINFIGMMLCAACSVVFKKNYMIGVVAIIIYLVLKLLKEVNIKHIAAVTAMILCLILPSNIIICVYESLSGTQLNEGTPSILWVAMGTDIDNNVRAPGWYNGFNYSAYTESGYDSQAAAELGKEKVIENLEKIKNEPVKAFVFFRDKTISQWCEPMYQSVWSGPLESCNQYTHTELLQSIYNGKNAENAIATFSKFLCLIIWAFSFLFVYKHASKHDGWQIMFLFFIGGLIFHTLWEGKSQYIYPYVFCMIPFAMFAVADTVKTAEGLLIKIKPSKH